MMSLRTFSCRTKAEWDWYDRPRKHPIDRQWQPEMRVLDVDLDVAVALMNVILDEGAWTLICESCCCDDRESCKAPVQNRIHGTWDCQ